MAFLDEILDHGRECIERECRCLVGRIIRHALRPDARVLDDAQSRVAARSANAKEWKLDSFVVNSGNHMSATAQIALVRGKRRVQDAAMGTGPIYAAFRAVEKIIRHRFTLEDYRIEAVTERRDALGEVLVKISDARGTYRGRGVSTDVIEGSILALLVAVNRMMEARK